MSTSALLSMLDRGGGGASSAKRVPHRVEESQEVAKSRAQTLRLLRDRASVRRNGCGYGDTVGEKPITGALVWASGDEPRARPLSRCRGARGRHPSRSSG